MRAAGQTEPRGAVDADLVRLAQQGDGAAFEQIFKLHSRRVYALCLRMVGEPMQAEDLSQEVFLQVFRKIGTFRGESAFSTWMHRIAVNIVLMSLRRKSLKETPIDTLTSSEDESSQPLMESGGPDLRLNGVIDRITLRAAINELAPGYRAMFILHDIEGYEHHEIAEMFGCTAGNSKSQVHKARARLRELLQKAAGARRRRRGKSNARSVAPRLLVHNIDPAHA
jgi:RNA polymerase sigma-70 factor (ECF subfamily)